MAPCQMMILEDAGESVNPAVCVLCVLVVAKVDRAGPLAYYLANL